MHKRLLVGEKKCRGENVVQANNLSFSKVPNRLLLNQNKYIGVTNVKAESCDKCTFACIYLNLYACIYM